MIQGKLDQSQGLLEVDNSIGRDIKMSEVSTIISTLESWSDACENVLGTLQTQMDKANAERAQRIQRKDQLETEVVACYDYKYLIELLNIFQTLHVRISLDLPLISL